MVQCICFGTPAIGNAALAAQVYENGWEDHILNFILPGQTAYNLDLRLFMPHCNSAKVELLLHL